MKIKVMNRGVAFPLKCDAPLVAWRPHEGTLAGDFMRSHAPTMMAASNCRSPRLLGRSLEKYMDVSDVKVSEDDTFLSHSMAVRAINTTMKERIWMNRVASEIVFQALHPGTGNQLHDERVTEVREAGFSS